MGKHYSKEVKLEAVRMYAEGQTHGEITKALGIRERLAVCSPHDFPHS